jgi:hypothetical protein
LQGFQQLAEREGAVFDLQRNLGAGIAEDVDGSFVVHQRVEIAEQTIADGLADQMAARGRDVLGGIGQPVKRALGQRRQVFAGNLNDLGHINLDLHVSTLGGSDGM